MGQQASIPKPGVEIKVIGAGLSRTGTASFSRSLEILLDGPTYHGGTQNTLGPEIDIKSWIKILRHWPAKNSSDKQLILNLLRERLDGFAAITDAPGSQLVPELMELYPDAKVICTIRDPDAWVKSMAGVSSASTMWFLRFVLFPLPTLRFFVDYISVLRHQWLYLYGESEPATMVTWERHIAWLKEIVPADRLIFFDVKQGWGPLCTVLGKKVPDEPFPNINDGQAIDRLAKRSVQRGLIRWAGIFAVGAVILAMFMLRYPAITTSWSGYLGSRLYLEVFGLLCSALTSAWLLQR